MTTIDDDLVARLRAADPAQTLERRAAAPRGLLARRLRGRRRGVVARTTVAATCAVLATTTLAVGPVGIVGSGNGVAGVGRIVAEAARASTPPPGTIVRITSEVEVRSRGRFTQRRTSWVRRDQGGRVLGMRTLVTEAEGEDVVAGVDDVMTIDDGRSSVRSFDPRTERVTETPGAAMVPSVVTEAHALLRRAEAGDGTVRLVGRTSVGGRAAYRLNVTGIEDPARPGDHDELLVDTETYAPLSLRKHSEGIGADGHPFVTDYEERIVAQDTLPDTAEHRRQLELRGPTG